MSDDADSESTEPATPADPPEVPVDLDAFVEAVADLDDDLGDEAAAIRAFCRDQAEELTAARDEVEDLTSRLKRARADFENYKKRVERRREELRAEVSRRLIERIIDVRTDLRRAVASDDQALEDLVEGVKLTLREIDRLLDAEDVAEITPEVGDEVDPHRHEVMVRVPSDQPEGHVAEVFEPGYRHGEHVLRAAQVSVSQGPPQTEE